MKRNRKMAFFEVGRGELGREIQEDFDKAQLLAANRGLPIKIKVEITVHPPDANDNNYGAVSYSHQIVQPPYASRKHETVLQNGVVVADAAEPLEQLQMDLSINRGPVAFKNGTDNQ